MNKLWKQAASIIIAARSNICRGSTKIDSEIIKEGNTLEPNFKILVLKRGKSSRFFPGGYVFPGGTVEAADSSHEWLEIFESHGLVNDLLNTHVSETPQLSLFRDEVRPVPQSAALKITAIRETFEECGILLCKSKNSTTPSTWASFLEGHQLQQWQKRVQKNPHDFLKLCKESECIPDLWALHQWSNWVTPVHQPIRFDTIFYLVTIDQVPPSSMNELEMDDMKWSSPTELLQNNLQDSLQLPPPQYYEISRIVAHQSIEQLHKHGVQRSAQGCERWMAICKKADDGILFILPGDDLYPDTVNFDIKEKLTEIRGSMENLRKAVHKVHRIEVYESQELRIFVSNIEPSFGHVLPAT